MSSLNQVDSSILAAVNGTNRVGAADTAAELTNNFMTLLVAQLKNQDPLKPMENTELTSQLAQINTVSGIGNLNKTMGAVNDQLGASHYLQAASLIGKDVMVAGNEILVGDQGVATPFGLELESAAEQVRVSIVDGWGQLARSFDLGSMGTGSETFSWDGKLDTGEIAPAGSYRVLIESLSADGASVTATPLSYARVNGVSSDGSPDPLLDLGGVSAPVKLSEVKQIF